MEHRSLRGEEVGTAGITVPHHAAVTPASVPLSQLVGA